jgi:murein DD-endopeptidase MepM/ murein hydrolase activator NlpD
MSTGVHLHWEIWAGKDHGWSDNGKGFVEPIEFTKSVIASERISNTAKDTTPQDVKADAPAAKAAPKAAPKAAAPKAAKPKTVKKP